MSLLTASTAQAKEIRKCLEEVRRARLKTMPTICPLQGPDKIRQVSTEKEQSSHHDGYEEGMLRAQWEIHADPERWEAEGIRLVKKWQHDH